MRLDKFLAQKHKEVSRGKIQKAIKDGLVSVNDRKVMEPDFQVEADDMVKMPEIKKEDLKPFDFELKVVFENRDLAVIDKPAGLVVHPGAGNLDETLANALLSKYPEIKSVGDPHRPGIVHRLDEDTSGLIVVARNQQVLEYLKNLFQTRNVEKEYLALVHGVPKMYEVINAPLEKVPLKHKMRVGSGKEAVTEYNLLASDPSRQFSLLRVKLHTGRTHQIRAHLAHVGHPIVGDAVYGKKSELIDRQFLHAYRLKFKLLDGSVIELFSELPQDLRQVLDNIGIKYDSANT
ncbi:MAG: RluA family pseudouridine synthase [Candidatus Doudnabacteria bacterium]|nr:RluA family pseudouridine synthase [Candidatus Doudnabacteria bacterium]